MREDMVLVSGILLGYRYDVVVWDCRVRRVLSYVLDDWLRNSTFYDLVEASRQSKPVNLSRKPIIAYWYSQGFASFLSCNALALG